MTHEEWLSALRVGSLWVFGILALIGICAVMEWLQRRLP